MSSSTASSGSKMNLLSFSGNTRILHLSWMAFFISFFVWFNFAPLLVFIRETFALDDQQVKTLLILNVALTIPARIIVGMLVDKIGPRRVFSVLLAAASVLCFMFAFAQSFEQLAALRFLLGFVGAGFVIGIRLIAEWYPVRQLGVAEGIYGGWGNFGSAAGAVALPTIALMFGGDDGWRYAVALTGLIALLYSVLFYIGVRDTPKGSTYFKPKKVSALEVTSQGDFVLYFIMNIPMYAALAVLAWKLGPTNLGLLDGVATNIIYLILLSLYAYQSYHIVKVNRHVFKKAVPEIERYKFRNVAVLNLAYMVSFGSELAVVSMLPLFFNDTYELTPVMAGLLASIFAGLNLVARPGGGLFSDKFGRRKSLLILFSGIAASYFLMSFMDASWPIFLVVAMIMVCSVFVNGGNGAIFAMVPLIKRRLTGQIAGMTGAYGNVGAVSFLTVLSFVSPQIFFLVISCAAGVTLIAIALFLEEPAGHMVETLPDGTVQMIEVS